ncbi:MAG TPA: isoamylase early set domain-containing protein [Gemmatimonadaceae bacterium]|jgi:hypothetical protein
MRVDGLLEKAIAQLQTPVPVRASWRAALLREIAAAPPPRREEPRAFVRRVRWTLHPTVAIAAAVACLAVGLASGVLLSRTRAASSADASSSAELTTVRFVIDAPSARQVSLVGDFNRWDASANPMRPSQDGQSWIIEVPLSRGRHTYAFVVDGDVLRDPSAPTLVDDDFGVRNSIIFVGDGRT